MDQFDTFAVLKFGTFTADDIKHRWITGNNSKFASLPNEVKIRWLELLRDRYAGKVIPARKTEFINEANRHIEKAESGDYSDPFFASSTTFYSFVSFSSFCTLFSFYSVSFSSADFTQEVMNKLAIDSKLLNKAIREYSDD